MDTAARVLAVAIVGACTLGPLAALPLPAAELCPSGGLLIRAVIDKDRALAWAAGPRAADVGGAEGDRWVVLAQSAADRGIGIMVAPGFVFFGVAGRGGEVYPRDVEQAFGADLGKLREAVRKDLAELVLAGVARVDGADALRLADLAGLGTLERQGDRWVLQPAKCQAVGLPVSGR